MFVKFVLALILSFPLFHEDRAPELAEVKRAQLETVAHAVTTVTAEVKGWPGSRRDLAKLLLTVARHESQLSLRIMAGNCKPKECDRGRARGPFQMHEGAATDREAWLRLVGTDPESVLHATREAARALVRARRTCRSLEDKVDWLPMTLASYAGRGCLGRLPDMPERVRTFKRLDQVPTS